MLQQSLSHAATPKILIDVNADLRCAAIGTAREESLEIKPANNAAIRLRDPEGILLWRMFPEPLQTRFDRGRLKLRCHHSRRHSGVVNLDNRRQVNLSSIADDQIHGFRFLCGLRLAAGELVAVPGEPAGVVAAGLVTGNANVGDGKAEPAGDAVDGVPLGDGEGLGVELGVGEGAMIFSQ